MGSQCNCLRVGVRWSCFLELLTRCAAQFWTAYRRPIRDWGEPSINELQLFNVEDIKEISEKLRFQHLFVRDCLLLYSYIPKMKKASFKYGSDVFNKSQSLVKGDSDFPSRTHSHWILEILHLVKTECWPYRGERKHLPQGAVVLKEVLVCNTRLINKEPSSVKQLYCTNYHE